jgi:hypothetical protein
MEPYDDPELLNLIREWQVPPPSKAFEERVLRSRKTSWPFFWKTWRFLLTGRISVPVPTACCLVLLIAAGAWRWADLERPVPPLVVVKTERVEVPVIRDRVVTKFIHNNAPVPMKRSHALTFHELKPVAELRPRVIRGGNDQN